MMISIGIGGWTFAPWKGRFYPEGLPAKRELEFASRALTSIEINGTFYRSQGPASFKKWREETPDGFVFAVKGHRAVVNQKKLGEAGEAVGWFMKSGVLELGDKLGPLNWQLAPFKRFEREDIGAFLKLLPRQEGGRPLRHVLEVRHQSFADAAFVDLCREEGVAVAYADAEDWPAIPDVTADFVYARLQRCTEEEPTGYPAAALDLWAKRAKEWAAGKVPTGLTALGSGAAGDKSGAKDVFIYFISGYKPHAPAAAMALIERVGRG
ncbi:MAG: DUF72 domain-containing protein [Bauldia sp.]